MKTKTISLVAALMLVIAQGVLAQTANTAARTQSLASLPDMRGVWRVTGSTQSLSGDAKNAPSFKADWQGKKAPANEQDTAIHYCATALPRLLGAATPFEMIVTPNETLVYYASREVRHLWTDGRNHPAEDERWPMYWGESKGAWQGDTLVMETINLHGNLWIDASSASLSDDARLTERIRMTDANHFQDEVTITDSNALTKPWQFTRTYERLKDTQLSERSCRWNAGQARS